MKTIFDFIQRIIKDLKLENLAPKMREAFELQIGKVVDKQIEKALASTITDQDWAVYDNYLKTHPDAAPQEAFDEMLKQHPEAQKTIEEALMNSYEDVMLQAEAMDQALKERAEKESNN